MQDVLEKRARDRGLWSAPESRWSRVAGLLLEASRSNDFIAGRSRAAVWVVACGRASPRPCLRERPAPLGPAGRVGHVRGAELHLPGELCGQARAGWLPHRSQRRLRSQGAAPRPPAPDVVLISRHIRTAPRHLSEAVFPQRCTLCLVPQSSWPASECTLASASWKAFFAQTAHTQSNNVRVEAAPWGLPAPGRQEGSR